MKKISNILKNKPGAPKQAVLKRSYNIAFLVFTVGSLLGLFLWEHNQKSAPEIKYELKNPAGLSVQHIYPVRETQNHRLSAMLKNTSSDQWGAIKLDATVLIGGRPSSHQHSLFTSFNPNDSEQVYIDFSDIANSNIQEPITYSIDIFANKPPKE